VAGGEHRGHPRRDLGVAVGSTAMTANFTSPDAGTVAIDYQNFISVTGGTPPVGSFGATLTFAMLKYVFTPTVDSVFKVNYSVDDVISNISPLAFVYKTQALSETVGSFSDYQPFVGPTGSVSYDLMAGITYEMGLGVNDQFQSDVTSIWTGSQRYSFSITERPTAPPAPRTVR